MSAMRVLIPALLLLTIAGTEVVYSDVDETRYVNIKDIPSYAPSLEGTPVETSGFLVMNDRSTNLVSTPEFTKEQVCIGLIVTEDDYKALKPYDHTWQKIVGYFGGHHCVGNEYCAHSCGPDAIVNPRLSKSKVGN